MNSFISFQQKQIGFIVILLTFLSHGSLVEMITTTTITTNENKSIQDDSLSRHEEIPSTDESLAESRAILSSGNGYQSLLNKNSFLFGSLSGNRNRTMSTQRDVRDTRCK